MYTEDEMNRYNHQQTDLGKVGLQTAENLKRAYVEQLHIPAREIKTGRMNKMINERTGEIRFYET